MVQTKLTELRLFAHIVRQHGHLLDYVCEVGCSPNMLEDFAPDASIAPLRRFSLFIHIILDAVSRRGSCPVWGPCPKGDAEVGEQEANSDAVVGRRYEQTRLLILRRNLSNDLMPEFCGKRHRSYTERARMSADENKVRRVGLLTGL